MMNTDEDKLELEGQDKLNLSVPPHKIEAGTEIRIAKEQSSVFELLRREGNGELVLAPDFQRKNVWKKEQQSELIESILMGIPIPLIYLFEDENGVRHIIDGMQRTTALKLFINNELSLTNLSMLPDLSGKKFKDIPPLLKAKLEDYHLHCYVVQPPTPEHIKFTIFERINRGGMSLNKQEMRHALYQGKATTLLQELAESKAFQLSTGHSVKLNRMRGRYLVLRFIALYLLTTDRLSGIQYNSDIDTFLALVMKYLNTKASDDLIKQTKTACLSGMNNAHQVLGSNAFRFRPKGDSKRRPVNMGLFEVLVFALCELNLSNLKLEKAKEILDEYKLNIDQTNLFSSSLDTAERVKGRFIIAKQQITQGLEECLNN